MAAPGTCKGCGATIVWERLHGRWHPCDPKKFSIIADNKLVTGYESHYATCANADEFRNKARGQQ